MTLAILIDTIDGCSLSNKMCPGKEEQGNAVLAIHFIVKDISPIVHW